MGVVLQSDPVPLFLDADGELRVSGTRVLLDSIVAAFRQGTTPETITEMYSTLTRADVYAVIAYYLRHQAELDEYLRQREQEAEAIRQQNRARFPPDGVRERLLTRLKQKDPGQAHAATDRG
jgi:uncharacterized protein (DUF433 family)